MSEVLEVTDETFTREVLESEIPVLVDFFGDHCAACTRIAPILDGIAREQAGVAKIVKIHAADNPRASARYGVRAMPTVLAFGNGEVRGQLVGAKPASAFLELIAAAR